MKYRVDVKLTGYMTVEVEAKSIEEAEEKATEVFADKYFISPIGHLQSKKTEANCVSEESNE